MQWRERYGTESGCDFCLKGENQRKSLWSYAQYFRSLGCVNNTDFLQSNIRKAINTNAVTTTTTATTTTTTTTTTTFNNNNNNTWITYGNRRKTRIYRKQPYWALHTYLGKCWYKSTHNFEHGEYHYMCNEFKLQNRCNNIYIYIYIILETWYVSGI